MASIILHPINHYYSISSNLCQLGLVFLLGLVLMACDGAETLAEDPIVETPTSEDIEVILLGARLYDDWIVESNADSSVVENRHWLLAPELSPQNIPTIDDTWRCSSCHGWDYRGNDGAYGPGSDNQTGFVGINRPMENEWSVERIYNVLDTGVVVNTIDNLGTHISLLLHRFSDPGLLSEEHLWALAAFIKFGAVDTSNYISDSPPISIREADEANGEFLFGRDPTGNTTRGNCSFCHSPVASNQTKIADIRKLAIENPWKTLHKIRFGQPGSAEMLGMYISGFSVEDSRDVLAYATLMPVTQ